MEPRSELRLGTVMWDGGMVGSWNHGLRWDDPGRAWGAEHKEGKGQNPKQHQSLHGRQRKSCHLASINEVMSNSRTRMEPSISFLFTTVSSKVRGHTMCNKYLLWMNFPFLTRPPFLPHHCGVSVTGREKTRERNWSLVARSSESRARVD